MKLTNEEVFADVPAKEKAPTSLGAMSLAERIHKETLVLREDLGRLAERLAPVTTRTPEFQGRDPSNQYPPLCQTLEQACGELTEITEFITELLGVLALNTDGCEEKPPQPARPEPTTVQGFVEGLSECLDTFNVRFSELVERLSYVSSGAKCAEEAAEEAATGLAPIITVLCMLLSRSRDARQWVRRFASSLCLQDPEDPDEEPE